MKCITFCLLLLLPLAGYAQTIPPVALTKPNFRPHPRLTPEEEYEALNRETALHSPPQQITSAAPLTNDGLENLIAFTRLMGYVRYFHASDEALANDWDSFAIDAITRVEVAGNAEELAQILGDLFVPIAPSVQVYATGTQPSSAPEMLPVERDSLVRIYRWEHFGVGFDSLHSFRRSSIYRSQRVDKIAPNGQAPNGFADPREPFTALLEGGVTANVPLTVYGDVNGTFPRPTSINPWKGSTSPFTFSALDRSTRLTAVAIAWNVFQHFYPYFDVVDTDWPGALRAALKTAANDGDELAFLNTLRRLVAKLYDGHGRVSHSVDNAFYVPKLMLGWIEDRLVVTFVLSTLLDSIKPGDAVLSIDGVPAADYIAAKEELISGATLQWKRYLAVRELLAGLPNSQVTLEIQPFSGEPSYTTGLQRNARYWDLDEPRPPMLAEFVLKPGFFYLDINRISDDNFLNILPQLEKEASGIIFDLRGYPNKVSPIILNYLTDTQITSAQWHIPMAILPDQMELTFNFSNWPLEPLRTLSDKETVFLTDGRAISYAETYMGIVEAYQLSYIVGGPTAGTNGNINPFILPGGYLVNWTGMKVLKHDGSQHHGIGILPTHPASRTIAGVAAGRDELLQAALRLLSSSTQRIDDAVPQNFALHPNYPNPFNPGTTIRYDVAEQTLVTLKVYNMLGQEVVTLIEEVLSPGTYETQWQADRQLAGGIYVYRLQAATFTETRRLALLK